MKTPLLFLSICFALVSNAQSFTKTTPISTGTDYGNYHPQIEIAGDGAPVVLWTGSDSVDLYFAKYDGVGAFDTPIKLNPDGVDVQDFNWSGADLAIEGNNIHIIFKQQGYTTGAIYTVKSTDNGVTFGDTVRVDQLASGFGQYPDIAVYNDTVWATFMDHDAAGLNPEYVVARSVDGGLTFEPEVAAGSLWTGEACDCCQPEIIVDENRVIVFFRNNNSNVRDIKAVVSYDRGATFTDSYSVDDHNWVINACPSTGADAKFMGADKTLTIYKSNIFGSASVFINQYDIAAGASDGVVEISSASGSNSQINYPQVDYEIAESMIGVVWEAAGNGMDVYINASSSGVNGLLSANAMNVTDESGTQSKPDIIIRNGVFHMVYMDYNDQDVKYVQLTSNFSSLQDVLITSFKTETYPSPAVEQFTLSFENKDNNTVNLSLYNLNGAVVYSTENLHGNMIVVPRNKMKAGEYFYQLSVGANKSTGKITFID